MTIYSKVEHAYNLTHQLHFWICPKEICIFVPQKTFSRVFTAVLLIKVNIGSNPHVNKQCSGLNSLGVFLQWIIIKQ